MEYRMPLWLMNIESALQFDCVFVLHGQEIKDDVVMPGDGHDSLCDAGFPDLRFMSFRESLKYMLARNGFDALISYDIGNRFSVDVLSGRVTQDSAKKALGIKFDDPNAEFFQDVPELISKLNDEEVSRSLNYAVMVDCFSETDPNGMIASSHPNVEQMMLASYQLAKTKVAPFIQSGQGGDVFSKHPVFWVVKDTSVMPSYLLGGIGIRQIPISAPSFADRNLAIGVASYPFIPHFVDSGETRREWAPLFEKAAKAMSGLSVTAIEEISQSIMRGFGDGSNPEEAINRIIEAAREYRVGLTENPWGTDIVKSNIENGVGILGESVKGQEYAIRKSVDVLRMAALNINGIDSKDAGTAPRGCLFFAGPTGVGKTELAKSIAKLVFGSEDDMIRFDMSEFAEAHNASRLVGSPPGYVGNEQGGELTNKVKANPFSLLLFDEIEKADGSIFDKFLQILSDGRMTDGRGDTVYFTETIIVFTSNKGVTEMQSWLAERHVFDPDEYRREFKQHIEAFFRDDLKRPEVFGRIDEDNIIVFNPIDGGIASQIAELGIGNILANIRNQQRIEISLSDAARDKLIAMATDEGALRYGGRGIKNALRKVLMKPLAEPLFAAKRARACSLSISDVRMDGDVAELVFGIGSAVGAASGDARVDGAMGERPFGIGGAMGAANGGAHMDVGMGERTL